MPYKSQAQHRLFRALEAKGELKPGTASRWAHETKSIKSLPEKVAEAPTLEDVFRKHLGVMKGPNGHWVSSPEAIEASRRYDERKRLRKELAAKLEQGGLGGQQADDIAAEKIAQLAHEHDTGAGLRKDQIARGAKVELEHTKSLAVARQIAMDHLRERPDYYALLDKMEKAPPAKVGSGDMCQYFMDHPKKLKERLERKKHASYKLQGERKFRGLDLAIENKKGSRRSWYDPHGKEKGSTLMHADYGYIRLTEGTDGDHVDVYVGPDEDAAEVYIIDQMKKPDFDKFDEQKCMLGFASAEEAKALYLKQYDNPKFFGSMKAMPFEEFKMKALDKSNHGKKLAFDVLVKHADLGLADRLDDAGIAMLALPSALALARPAAGGLMSAGRALARAMPSSQMAQSVGQGMRQLGARGFVGAGRAAEAIGGHIPHHALELGGLALVAPSITHGIASKVAPPKAEEKTASPLSGLGRLVGAAERGLARGGAALSHVGQSVRGVGHDLGEAAADAAVRGRTSFQAGRLGLPQSHVDQAVNLERGKRVLANAPAQHAQLGVREIPTTAPPVPTTAPVPTSLPPGRPPVPTAAPSGPPGVPGGTSTLTRLHRALPALALGGVAATGLGGLALAHGARSAHEFLAPPEGPLDIPKVAPQKGIPRY